MKFDYLQLKTEAEFIRIDEKKFDTISGSETSHGLDIKRISVSARNDIRDRFDIPSNRIKVSIIGPYLSIGITSKMLGSDSRELITENTIQDCLDKLVEFGLLVDIDSKAIRTEAKVTVAEVTKDLIHSNLLETKDYESFSLAVSNPYKWSPKNWSHGFGLRKEVKEDKEFLCIYDKAQEIKLDRVRHFRERYLTDNPYKDEKSIRIEARLLSAKSIRKHFGGNRVEDLFEHEGSVLSKIFRSALINSKPIQGKKLSKIDKKNFLFAQNQNFDLAKIAKELNLKDKHNRARAYRDVMKSIILANPNAQKSIKNLDEILQKI